MQYPHTILGLISKGNLIGSELMMHWRYPSMSKTIVTELEMEHFNSETYFLHLNLSNAVCLVMYADDILLIGNNVLMLHDVKAWRWKCFFVKDLGDVAYILGIRIYQYRTKHLIRLSQSTYMNKILKIFNMSGSKRVSPMQHGARLSKDQCPTTSEEPDRMS
ncbi:hypothetical protein LXL04_008197 [Taraxacum kok-saghyz]